MALVVQNATHQLQHQKLVHVSSELCAARLLSDFAAPPRKPSHLAVAITVTALLYGGIFLILSCQRAEKLRPVEPEGQAISLSLIGPADGAVTMPQPSEELFKDLREVDQTAVQQSFAAAKPVQRVSISDLFDDHTDQVPVKAQVAKSGGAASTVTGALHLSGDPNAQVSLANLAGLQTGSSKGGVGPGSPYPSCWRRAAKPIPIKLVAILDNEGAMIGPPKVAQTAVPPTPAQLQAETLAMQAMAGCAPYRLASAPGMYRSFELDFSRTSAWIKPLGLTEVR